ncbi:MAG: 23S rRNA (uracil(1939)-C(5))-methyltransferase RlmD [Lachnospiraceae bacterium]|nr:23S rRNA (uracil(1939)-C(5))-methyltransferase RlmD [Lachnospiraceae bacterium]
MNKNDYVTVTIEDMSTTGEGIGKADGFTLFIKDAYVGDTVEAKVMKAKKTYGFAKLTKIITPSPDRVTPRCPIHKACGGCQIQALSYNKQLELKDKIIKNDLVRIGGFEEEYINSITEPIIGMEEPYHYRNKAQYPIGLDKEGNVVAGFYAGRTHSIIPGTDCAIGVPENKEILEMILAYMKTCKVAPYDEKSGKGLVRHVLIRKGFKTGEIMVCVIINGKTLPKSEILVDKLTGIPGMASISLNINEKNTNVIMGDTLKTLWGRDYIEDYIDDIKFRISPLSFFQVNPQQTEKLYNKALEYAGIQPGETVWDLYCGIGTISLFMAKKAERVYGVEIVPEAIEDARDNARINGLDNATFYVGKAEEVLPEKYEKEGIFADVIVVDPPRKGCDKDCLDTILKMQPKRVVYVSCDPATLSRDLKILAAGGYELKKVCGVDQFGHTMHVESIALLERVSNRKADAKVHIDVDLEDYYRIKDAQGKDGK